MQTDLTPGAHAALELQLSDARGDLAALIAERNGYIYQADELSALACEPGQRRVALNCRSASLRLKAFSLIVEISAAQAMVVEIERKLAGGSVLPEVHLGAEQVAAMDECAGIAA